MGRRSEASLASLLLVQRIVDLPVQPLKALEYWGLHSQVRDLGVLLGEGAEAIAQLTSVSLPEAERVASLLDAATLVAFELERLEQSGVSPLAAVDDEYPSRLIDRLGHSAPPLLYVAGPASLLNQPSLGIVGSRDVTAEGADVARDAASTAVANRHVVVSGGAKGVDQISMYAALENGGQTIGILAESLSRRLREPETLRAIHDGDVALCSPYKPTAGFSVANAMGRNKLIYALADATLVVASDLDKGGTWSGATEALHRSFGGVVVWTGAGSGPGNAELVRRGGHALEAIEALFPLQATAPALNRDEADQLSLDM